LKYRSVKTLTAQAEWRIPRKIETHKKNAAWLEKVEYESKRTVLNPKGA
jgi:hypothetical protein